MRRTRAFLTVGSLLLSTVASAIAWAQPAAAPKAEAPAPEEDQDGEGDIEEIAPSEEEGKSPAAPASPGDKPPAGAAPAERSPAAEAKAEGDETEAEADAEEPVEEDVEDDGAAAMTRPPKKGHGAVWGVARDSVDKEPLGEASVSVVGTKFKTMADDEGRYRLELPPGKYTLRLFYELHRPALIKDVVVVAGKVERLDADIVPDEAAVETFEVQTEADTASVEGQVLARQRSTAVGDGVGRAEISKSPAANAAQAAQRVVGATIVGGRFVYVRGLGERYTNALLNETPLPSPEPDRSSIPLDLFPSLILDNINIVKTFTPDIPADFAGGSVQIQTRELPSKPLFQASIGLGFDDRSTFRKRLAQRNSSTDFMGFDNGMRSMPKLLEDNVYNSLTPEQRLQADRDMNSFMSSRRYMSAPNMSLSAVAGNGWALPNDQRIGALATFNYSRSFQIDKGVLRSFRDGQAADGSPIIAPGNDYKFESGNDRVSWGALASVSYWPSQKHRITLLGLHTQLADSNAQVVEGQNYNRDARVVNTRLKYVSRALNFAQLRGEHDLVGLARARINWNAAYSHAGRNEPDTRDTVFQGGGGSPFNSVNTPENGSHLYAKQGESNAGGGLDWTQPFSEAADTSRVKVGGLVSLRSRDFSAKRFHLAPTGPDAPAAYSCGASFYAACPDGLYTNGNIGPILEGADDTKADDAYKARLNIFAGYALLDLQIIKPLRLTGGARLEATRQLIDPYSQDPNANDSPSARVNVLDVLPAVSLVYSATAKAKVRASVSQTLARPQLRELAPFEYSEYFGARIYKGNPDLKLTYITNYDLRFEYFPTQREVLAFSIFAKKFKDPIENIVINSGDGTIVPQNARGGTLIGVELEARRSLDFLTQALKDLTVIGNLTLAKSRVDLDTTDNANNVTNSSRAMVNQAGLVANFALDYANPNSGTSVRVLYNVTGKRIVQVGTNGFQDVYEQPRHSVDFTATQDVTKRIQLKLSGANLLGLKTIYTLGSANRDDRIQESRLPGRIILLSASYTH